MAKFSIKRRIITAVAAAELFLVASLTVLASLVMQRHALSSFDTALHGRVMNVVALVRYSEDAPPSLQFDGSMAPRSLDQRYPDFFRVQTSAGRVLASSASAPAAVSSAVPGTRIWNFVVSGVPYRALHLEGLPVLDSEEGVAGGTTLQVTYAAPTVGMRRSLALAIFYVLLGGVFLLAVSLWFSIRAVEKGLRPLSDLAAGAQSISASNWAFAPPASALGTKEVEPLTRAMSQMLETLHTAFQQQREFTANAAHELKTPVAILKSTLQSLLQQPRGAETYRDGINDALNDLARLESLLHSMLRLSRAEQRAARGGARELPAVDVVGTCEAALARLAPLAHSRGAKLSFSSPSPETLRVRAEPEDLEIVWMNLIENAIRYGPVHSQVHVSAARNNGSAVVAVEDSGPGIPAADLPLIFERFHRGDRSRSRESGGYGLGLAICKALVDSYGGSIAIHSSPSSGTRVVVELPAGS